MRHAQRLQVCVGHYELDALHAGINHAIDCVVAASTHTDNLDLGVVAGLFVKADANVVFFFHLRRPSLKFVFSFFSSSSLALPWRTLRLQALNRKVREGFVKFAEQSDRYPLPFFSALFAPLCRTLRLKTLIPTVRDVTERSP